MKHAPIRLFANPLLERLTHVHPLTVTLLWSTVIGVLLVQGGLGWPILAGLAAWSLFEYALHRWLFHWQPQRPAFRRLVFMLHGIHHLQPQDGTRVMMPPVVSVPVALALWVLVGRPLGEAFFAGFLLGYLAYDVIHWACHQMPFKTGLKRRHLLHHHVDAERNYGVSSPLWDRVFGTLIPPRA